MKITTTNPIIYSNACGCGEHSSFTGTFSTSNKDHVKEFQNFVNGTGQAMTADGIWGPKTQAAWTKFGTQFKQINIGLQKPTDSVNTASLTPPKQKGSGLIKVATSLFGALSPSSNPSVSTTPDPVASVVDQSTVPPTSTGMSTGMKIGIGVAIVGGIIASVVAYKHLKKK